MSGLGIAAVGVAAVWLAVLTGVTILVIRQIALLTARVEHTALFGPPVTRSLPDEGPKISSQIEAKVLEWAPELSDPVAHLLLLSANCSPCREFAAALTGEQLPTDRPVVVLVPGRPELADGISKMLPAAVTVVRDPQARDIAHLLGMQRVPSAVTTATGVVTAKIMSLDSVDQFRQFMESSGAAPMPNGREALAAKGVEHGY